MAQWVKALAMKVWSGILNSVIRFHMKVDQRKKRKNNSTNLSSHLHMYAYIHTPYTQYIFM